MYRFNENKGSLTIAIPKVWKWITIETFGKMWNQKGKWSVAAND